MDQLATLLIATRAAQDVARTCRYEPRGGDTTRPVARRLRRRPRATPAP